MIVLLRITTLMICQLKSKKNIRYLLRAGANPYLLDSEGMNCFTRAAHHDSDPKRLMTINLPSLYNDTNQRREAQKVLLRQKIILLCRLDEEQIASPIMDYIGDDIHIPIDD